MKQKRKQIKKKIIWNINDDFGICISQKGRFRGFPDEFKI